MQAVGHSFAARWPAYDATDRLGRDTSTSLARRAASRDKRRRLSAAMKSPPSRARRGAGLLRCPQYRPRAAGVSRDAAAKSANRVRLRGRR